MQPLSRTARGMAPQGNIGENADSNRNPVDDRPMTVLNQPEARTDVKLVHRIGKEVRTRKVLSKNEIADLLDGMLPPEPEADR